MSALRLPRTIRLDPSDTFVFAQAAEPGEWAVTGSFLFVETDPAALDGKTRAAFRSGFVGVTSFGFSTLVVVTDASPEDLEAAVRDLAGHIRAALGAPDNAAAEAAAREELAISASLCTPPAGTVLALHRTLEDGALREQFRTLNLRPEGALATDRLHGGARAFAVVETDEEEPEERIDLAALAEGGRR